MNDHKNSIRFTKIRENKTKLRLAHMFIFCYYITNDNVVERGLMKSQAGNKSF